MRSRNRQVYTVSEAAELLGIGRSTAYEMVARDELESVKIGGRRFVTRPTLEAIIGIAPPLPADLAATQPAAAEEITLAEPARSSPAPKTTQQHSNRSRQPHLPLS